MPFSQSYNFHQTKYINDSVNNKRGIMLSFGAGLSIFRTSFVISPNVTMEFFEHFHISAGVDIYYGSKNVSGFISINVIPYYALRIYPKTIFHIGAGISSFKATIVPIFSSRFDHELFNNHYLGIELKSLLTGGADQMPGPVILLNYSIRF